MKKIISLVLALVMCLSLCACGQSDACNCDCPQCAQCEKKTHSHETVDVIMDSSETTVEQDNNGNKIVFPEPVLMAEDNKVRIELVGFIQEESPWKDIGKYVTLKFTNYADYEVGVWLENLAVNNESADASYRGGEKPNILPGETTTYFIEIRDAFNNALDSLDQLYTLKGRFKVLRRTGTNSYADAYEIPFSIPDALNNRSDSTSPNSEAAPLEQASSDKRVEEVIELIDEIVLEDIVVTDTVKENLNGIYAKYNALTDEEREKVSNYEILNKAKDTYNEMWVKSLIKIEKAPLYKNNYTGELELDIIWVNNSPKTIKYINFTAGIKNSVGDYFTKDGQKFAIYQQVGPFKTNYRKPNDDAYWPTGVYANPDEVGWAVINEIEIIYMDGSKATIKEEDVHFAFPK